MNEKIKTICVILITFAILFWVGFSYWKDCQYLEIKARNHNTTIMKRCLDLAKKYNSSIEVGDSCFDKGNYKIEKYKSGLRKLLDKAVEEAEERNRNLGN